MSYVEFEVPEGLAEKVYRAVEKAKDSGAIRKGANEVTKAIERNVAKLVIVAGDVSPPEIVMHISAMCKEKSIPYVFVPSREELGIAAGLSVQSSTIAISETGSADKDVKDILTSLKDLKK